MLEVLSKINSPRIHFQTRYFLLAEPGSVLNIGSSEDPLHFGAGAVHLDMDRYTQHERFVQGDAHRLPFKDQAFDTVIMGDIHEHALDPTELTVEGARVAKRRLAISIFEEWRLPGSGQWIIEAQAGSMAFAKEQGYESYEEHLRHTAPHRIGVDDIAFPHLAHINQFVDDDIDQLVCLVESMGFRILSYQKVPEATFEEHTWNNWLVCLERLDESGLKLNLGASSKVFPGWVNVDIADMHAWCHEVIPRDNDLFARWFVQADLRKYLDDLEDDSVEAIVMIHVLDHFAPRDALIVLKECLRVMRPGGVLRVAVEDLGRIIEVWQAGDLRRWSDLQPLLYNTVCEDMRLGMLIFGNLSDAEEYTGHKMGYTVNSLSELLGVVGWGGKEIQHWCGEGGESWIDGWSENMDTQPDHSLVMEVRK